MQELTSIEVLLSKNNKTRMESLKNIYRTTVAIALLTAATIVSAQENNNRDSNGKNVRGPYETNRLFDNVWIGVAGGVNVYENSFNDPGSFGGRIAPSFDFNIGKWVTPSVGVRLGYSGINAHSWSTTELPYTKKMKDGLFKNQFGSAFVHADVMWNISNAFSGYKETRTWNFAPFVAGGVAYSYKKGSGYSNKEFAAAVGLYNEIRVSNRVNLTLEARQMIIKGGYDSSVSGGLAGMSSLTFGVAVKLGRTGFKRSHSAEYQSTINDLEIASTNYKSNADKLQKELDALRKENEALKAKVADMEKNPKIVKEPVMLDVTPGAVFFNIGQTTLSKEQMFQLEFYIKNVIAQDKDKVFTLTGYADKQTGSAKRNKQLSEMRVNYVSKLLQEKYNIPAERLVIKSEGSAVDRWGDPTLNRCVVIE